MTGIPQDREALAEKVISLVKDSAYPFGGYLRDKIAGEDFNDVDLFFPDRAVFSSEDFFPKYTKMGEYSFRSLMKNSGLTCVRTGVNRIYNRTTGLRLIKETYRITDDLTGARINVDTVRSQNGTYGMDHPFTSLDADINSLWYNKSTGKVEVAPHATYTLETVLQHIAHHVFEIPADVEVSGARINKLLKKGYKPFLLEEDNSFNNPQTQEVLGKEKKMSTERGFMDTLKSDMEKAAYRSASTQMTNGVKKGLLLMMKDKGADDGVLSVVTEMLDTEGGAAFISAFLGHGLQYAPMIGNDPRVARLSEEFRVEGYAKGMNILFGAVMQYILPSVLDALKTLPPASVSEADMAELTKIQNAKMRVADVKVPDLAMLAEKEAEAEVEQHKTSRRSRTA